MPRIHFGMNLFDLIFKLSGGNPGAINALRRIYREGHTVDPESEVLFHFMTLDTFEIFDDKINILYLKICNGSLVHFLAVIRGLQLGILSQEEVHSAILGKPYSKVHPFSVQFFDLITKVKEIVPSFK